MQTELELVNHILHTLGTSTTSTLETQQPSVVRAKQTLATYSKEFQGIGWWFNKEIALKLLPDANGRVLVPAEAMEFRVTQCMLATRSASGRLRFVRRGKYVYDTIDHTDILNVAVWADLTMLLAVEDLPDSAATYLKHFAAESAFLDDDGDINVHRRLQERTARAWAFLKQDEIASIGPNALQSPLSQRLKAGMRGTGYATRNETIVGGGVY